MQTIANLTTEQRTAIKQAILSELSLVEYCLDIGLRYSTDCAACKHLFKASCTVNHPFNGKYNNRPCENLRVLGVSYSLLCRGVSKISNDHTLCPFMLIYGQTCRVFKYHHIEPKLIEYYHLTKRIMPDTEYALLWHKQYNYMLTFFIQGASYERDK